MTNHLKNENEKQSMDSRRSGQNEFIKSTINY